MHPCEIRTERDVDWAVDRVLLGERVVAHVGGLHRPRRHQLKREVAVCCLQARIEVLGGHVLLGQCTSTIGPMTRGRTVLLLPPEPDGGDFGGVREPRQPLPNPSAAGADISEHS
ncbi:MAG: hypothetical protein R8J94_15150 [Acidimicrobiia bacterium]|nr:hypothetical protein [Acidimicrobiia bacterium]